MDTIQNHPATQNVVDTVSNGDVSFVFYPDVRGTVADEQFSSSRNPDPIAFTDDAKGPVAETVKDQHAKTTSEFRNLADSRTRPDQKAATGQPLTRG